ncbi:hypothetical protein HanIR_Chr16g0803291 [Helianthus annuus]|nr:hypothetical protein HanIR_Chr16g0803291 [Helianthus annuus]
MDVEDGGGFMYKDLLPFAGMVMVECMLIGAATLYKHATIQGINYYVFSFYVLLIGFVFLFPCLFLLHRYFLRQPVMIGD